jgi:hypothetical protein
MKPIFLLLKSMVQGYTRRDGVVVKPHSDRRTKRAAPDPHQMILFPAPARKLIRPNPFKGLDPVKSTGDLFGGDPAHDPERIKTMAEGAHKAAEHEAAVRAADAPRREANYQHAVDRAPKLEMLDGVEVMRSPGSNYAAVPVSGKRSSSRWQVFNVKTREPITQLRKDEVSPWLLRMADE